MRILFRNQSDGFKAIASWENNNPTFPNIGDTISFDEHKVFEVIGRRWKNSSEIHIYIKLIIDNTNQQP